MSMKPQHSHARVPDVARHLGIAVAILMCAALGACTAAPPPTSVTTATPAEAVTLPAGDVDLGAGTYLFDGFGVLLEVTVPEGWSWAKDRVLSKDAGDPAGVFVWFGHASYVPTDACQWPSEMADVGPSVEAFADALSAQTSTAMTEPREITVGRYSGIEFDFSVEGVAGLDDCSGSKICIHSESPSCTRWYHASVAQRETYRVIDLDDERAILTFGEFDDTTNAALVNEAQAVFDSITFVSE